MNENSQLSNDQSGFLKLRSTVTCLLINTDDWYNGLDLGKLVGLVFIDLQKAFEMWITKFSAKSLNSMEFKTVNSLGLNPISSTASNFVGLMV